METNAEDFIREIKAEPMEKINENFVFQIKTEDFITDISAENFVRKIKAEPIEDPLEDFPCEITLKHIEDPVEEVAHEVKAECIEDFRREMTSKHIKDPVEDDTHEVKAERLEDPVNDSTIEIRNQDFVWQVKTEDGTTEIKAENFDEKLVTLDTYNSDLNLVIDASRFSAKPLTTKGFAFMWAGARATHGASKGKFCFEVKISDHLTVTGLPADEPDRYVVRVGFSVDSSTMQLGEDPLSYGYDGTGKITTNCQLTDFGEPFTAGDVILGAVDADSEQVQIGFAKNGKFLGWAFQVRENELKGLTLFPHILTKNVSFEVNMGQKDHPYFPLPDPFKDFAFIGCLPPPQRESGARPPKAKEDCEVIMMCGLPGAGKSVWAANYAANNPAKKFNVLGRDNILDKMKVRGLPNPRSPGGRWDFLVHRAKLCMVDMYRRAPEFKRNYILDQDNLYPWDTSSMMRTFEGFRRKAVVVLPSEAEYQRRSQKRCSDRLRLLREEKRRMSGKTISGKKLNEMKANFILPRNQRIYDEVIYTDLQKEDAEKLLHYYKNIHKADIWSPKKIYRMSTSYHLNRGGRAGFNSSSVGSEFGKGGVKQKKKPEAGKNQEGLEGGSKGQKKIKLDTNQGGFKGGKKKLRKLQKRYGESSGNNFLRSHHGSGGRQPYSHQDGGGRMDFYRQGPPGSYAESFSNNFRGGYGRMARGGFYGGMDFDSQNKWSPWQQYQ